MAEWVPPWSPMAQAACPPSAKPLPAPPQSDPYFQPRVKKTKKQPSSRNKSRKQTKKRKKKLKRIKLKEGEMVQSKKAKWKIMNLLGSGGFGDVYKVKNMENKEEYAMKTEMIDTEHRVTGRLKVELEVLQQCEAEKDPDRKRHFVALVDKGRIEVEPKFNFLIMGLVGPSLEDIRSKHFCGRDFSRPTAMRVAEQTLKAVFDLHFIGWLHRDIKPQNFAVGREAKQNTVFILDFGVARKIFQPGTRLLKKPRAKVKFLGTIRFASRACHFCVEQGRKDDLESWLYMVVDLFDLTALPWKGIGDKAEVALIKDKFFLLNYPKAYSRIQKMQEVANYINGLQYAAEPDYAHMVGLLEAVKKENKIDTLKDFDWMGKLVDDRGDSSSSEASSDNRQSGSDSDSDEKQKKSKKGSKKVSKMSNRSRERWVDK